MRSTFKWHVLAPCILPSGNDSQSYGQWPFIVSFSINRLDFPCYVSLPEANHRTVHEFYPQVFEGYITFHVVHHAFQQSHPQLFLAIVEKHSHAKKNRPPLFILNKYWLVVSNPLKHISQLGWLFPIYGKINMFQTTNQNSTILLIISITVFPGESPIDWILILSVEISHRSYFWGETSPISLVNE